MGFTASQLYSTASYQAHDLTGIHLGSLFERLPAISLLAGTSPAKTWLPRHFFNGRSLAEANFSQANLANAVFNGNFLVNTDLSLDDTARSRNGPYQERLLRDTIRPDGQIIGLDLAAGQTLVVRNNNGNSTISPPLGPIGISVLDHLTMGTGTLSPAVRCRPVELTDFLRAQSIPVSLAGGTLELTFQNGVDPASQVGRVFHVFDWTGVSAPPATSVYRVRIDGTLPGSTRMVT